MDRKYKNRLLKLADFLDKLPPRNFKIHNWVTGEKPPVSPTCKTAACAIGWAPVCFPRSGLTYEGCNTISVYFPDGSEGFEGAATFFGISYCDAKDLFSEDNYSVGARVSAKEVAARVRQLVADRTKDPRAAAMA
jgi:hypothetical protein